MISDKHLNAFRKFYAVIHPTDINWVLTGSLAFAFQGLPVTPADIDIQTDTQGAYAIEQHFSDCVVRPVSFSSIERIRSHFGELEIGGVKVEIMGDLQKRLDDGTWETPPDLSLLRRFVDYDGMCVPVLALEYEYQAYLRMGRAKRAMMIKAFIEER